MWTYKSYTDAYQAWETYHLSFPSSLQLVGPRSNFNHIIFHDHQYKFTWPLDNSPLTSIFVSILFLYLGFIHTFLLHFSLQYSRGAKHHSYVHKFNVLRFVMHEKMNVLGFFFIMGKDIPTMGTPIFLRKPSLEIFVEIG